MTKQTKLELSNQNRSTNFVVTNFCLVCGVRIRSFKAGKFCQHLNIALIIFNLLILSCAPKHQTFWWNNGSRLNSHTSSMVRASKSRPDRRRNVAYGVLVFTASISSKPS